MASIQNIKAAVLGTFALLFFTWLFSGTLSKTVESSTVTPADTLSVSPTPLPDEYVGSETCAACHDAQFKEVSDTKHGILGNIPAW